MTCTPNLWIMRNEYDDQLYQYDAMKMRTLSRCSEVTTHDFTKLMDYDLLEPIGGN